ncbi:MAG: hypothetical protein ACSLFO_03855 [Acidimicrobiales bacterium]
MTTGDRRLTPARLALLAGLAYLPFIGLGYGTDIDITNIRRSGESLLDGSYRYSRPPGAFPHEALTGVLDRLGGPWLVNLGSVVAAVVTLAALAHLVQRRHGARAGRIAVLVAATQPWFWVAATSLGDYLYALAFLLLGIDAAQRDHRLLAGLSFGVAIGFRSGTFVLVGAYLLAELTGRSIDDDPAAKATATRRRRWADVLVTGAVGAAAALVWFIPPWLSAGRTTQFLQNQFTAGDFAVMVARWGVKNLAFFGIITLVVLAVRAPVLLGALTRFRELVLVRFAVFAAVATELVYLRFPWKPVHLLPMVICLAILLAVSPRTSDRLVAVVVGCQLLLGMVSVTVAEPNVADAATGGRFAPGLAPGVIVNDIDCRLDPPHGGAWPDLDGIEADLAAVRVLECQARSWRAGEPDR